jgi:hypothetical protein
MRGGRRPGAGRPKGSKSRIGIAEARRRRMQRDCAEEGLMPFEYLFRLMRDVRANTSRRDWAAAQLMPYLYSKMPGYTVLNAPASFNPETGMPIVDVTPSAGVTTINILPIPPGTFLSDEGIAGAQELAPDVCDGA